MFQLANYNNLASRFLGFGRLFDDIDNFLASKPSAYPFFDIVKSDDGKRIEIAVAGFDKDDIDVSFNKANRTLTIKASRTDEDKSSKLYSSIASRSFMKTFVLDNDTEIKDAKVDKGILSIDLLESPKKEDEIKKITLN
jgi:molecular chaperone IbpA